MAKKPRKNARNGKPVRMGRPPKFSSPAVVLCVSIPENLVKSIDDTGAGRSDFVRAAIEEKLSRRKP